MKQTTLDGSFRQYLPTDFSRFSPEDTEHVGWYYTPIRNGKATWMHPYLNKNINVQIISFVIPLYMNNQKEIDGYNRSVSPSAKATWNPSAGNSPPGGSETRRTASR